MKEVLLAIFIGICLIDLVLIYACIRVDKQDKED